MRSLPLLFLVLGACTGTDGDLVDTDPADTEPDPRFDRSNWPAEVGGDRPARVVAPADWDGETLLPVVMLLHGYSANATIQDAYLGISERVDASGFVLVLPEGTTDDGGDQFWNATDACCNFDGSTVDDVGYLLGLLDEIEASMPVDPDRMGLIGHSNGGFMSYRLACEAPERIAAIVSLAGATWDDEADCGTGAPVRVLQIHGTADTTIGYAGGNTQGGGYPSAEESAGRWAERAGCSTPSTGAPVDYDKGVVGAETEPVTYADCAADVALWRMNGSGHIPGVNDAWSDAVVAWVLDTP